jgi:SSS family solute:Na+ symporter
MIAFVKDTLIFITVIAALIVIPAKLGGFGHIFDVAQRALASRPTPGSIVVTPAGFSAYISLALGSTFTLFLYPHIITGVLSSKSPDVIRRNTALLPAYSLLLAMIALLGYMAIAAGITPKTTSYAVPMLFKAMFPSWFLGVAYAAIAIGALVPAAIMSIAAANLVTRNIFTRYVRPNSTDADESRVAKLASLVVKVGALAFIICVPVQYAINLQLLGGVWILQTLPALAFALYGRPLHKRALLVGWLAGMVAGTAMAVSQQFSAIYPLHIGGASFGCYAAIPALLLNLALAYVLTWAFESLMRQTGNDVVPEETAIM